MKRGNRLKIILLIACSLQLAACQQKPLYKDNRVLMGTFVEVISPDKSASSIVFEEIQRLENLLSKYKPDSEIAQLNKTGKFKVSPETFFIIKKSKEFWQISDGAFDITIGPLMDLWGFTDKKHRVPEEGQIKNALKSTGSDKIVLHDADNVVEFILPGMGIDLGAIAKGYAGDCAVNKLKEKGIISCLINIGGQVFCIGKRGNGPWRVAIRDPRDNGLTVTLELKEQVVSTSGGYEQNFSIGKQRYSHILNPKTGYPADSKILSVTVIARDGLTADALSTAIFVLGKESGLDLVKRFSGVEVRIEEQ